MTRGRRLIVELSLFPALYAMSIPDPVIFGLVISVILVVIPAVTGTVAAVLVWTSRQAPDVETLRERADDSVTLFLVSLAGAGIGIIVIFKAFGIEFPGRLGLALLAGALLLIAVPALGFLRTWRSYWMPLVLKRRQSPEQGGPPKSTAG